MADVTQILSQIEDGDPHAAEQLLPLLYEELRKLAAAQLTQERPGQTLQPTALVHEAYLRLVSTDKAICWDSRSHFFGAAAEAMRRILVDNARRKKSIKHGGQFQRHNALLEEIPQQVDDANVVAIDEALTLLAQENPTIAKLVELRFFAGLTMEESAIGLGISVRTANRYWTYAKAFLHNAIYGCGPT
jgi:RNA polymerase sigma factor (TIGR02999 family)